MKKIIAVSLMIILCMNLVSCTSHSSITKASTTFMTFISIDAMHFLSENEMANKIKSGIRTSSDIKLENIDYYFRLKSLPEDTYLSDIRVKSFYIGFVYVVGDKTPDSKMNRIDFVWYRTMRGDDMQNGFGDAGMPWVPMSKNNTYSIFTSENYALNGAGEIDENLPKEQVCNVVMWVQDDYCFQVNAPLWFTEDDVLKYCVAEKVQIK
jgi:hypothetical protein